MFYGPCHNLVVQLKREDNYWHTCPGSSSKEGITNVIKQFNNNKLLVSDGISFEVLKYYGGSLFDSLTTSFNVFE